MITVFTPTYNRVHLLPRLYESLCQQTFKDFEWLIIDDGSTDNTEMVVQSWIAAYIIPVRYYKQENGGKHRAINCGVKEAQGELFFIADSDDMLPSDALQQVAEVYEQIKGDTSFAGVCGIDGTFDGCVIGSGLPQDVMDVNAIDLRMKYGVTGDMKEVFRISVMKDFPFPEISGERFCPEMLVWNRIATKYKLRFFNKVIYLAEYQNDGITSSIVRARMNSPVASMMTYAEMTNFNIPFKQKVKAAINYWRFRLCSDTKHKPKMAWWYHWVMPIGYMMHRRDLRNI